jgi:hypothetical protein
MSLNFNLSKISNWQELIDSETGCLKPLTEALVFVTLTIGMREITKKNVIEFACRAHLFESYIGPFLVGSTGAVPITLVDVQRHIGLSTNVRLLTRARFINTYIWPEVQSKVQGTK